MYTYVYIDFHEEKMFFSKLTDGIYPHAKKKETKQKNWILI